MSASPSIPIPGPQPRPERRRSTRRAVVNEQIVPVSLTGDNGGLVLDLCEGGLSVQAVARLPHGASTDVEFSLPDGGTRIRARGDVRWAEASGRAGIRIVSFQEGSAEALGRWTRSSAGASAVERTPPATAAPRLSFDVAQLESEIAALGPDLDGALQLIAERTSRICRANGTAIALGRRDEMTCRASSGAAPSLGVRLQADSGLSGQCVRSGLPVSCHDTEFDPRVDAAVCRALDLRSAVLVPIHDGEEVCGVLEVFSDRPRAFADADLHRLRQASELIATVLRRFAVAFPAATVPPVRLEEPIAAPALVATATPARISPPTTPAETLQPAQAAATAVKIESPASEAPKKVDLTMPAAEAPLSIPAAVTGPVPPAGSMRPSRQRLSSAARLALVVVASSVVAAGGWVYVYRRQTLRPAPAAPASSPAVPAMSPVPLPAEAAPQPVEVKDSVPAATAANSTDPMSGPGKSRASTVVADVPEFAIRRPNQKPAPDSVTPPEMASDTAALPSFTEPRAEVPNAPGPARQSQGVVPARLVLRVAPVYPEAARRLQIRGDVLLNAVVRENGTIGKVEVVKGNAMLTRAALDAVHRWRYEPCRLNGTPVEAPVSIRLHFDPNR